MNTTQRVRWMPQEPDTGGVISPSEPYALKGARRVREGGVGNVPNSDESGSRRGVATSFETSCRADS